MEYYPTDVAGTGEVDHDTASDEEREEQKEDESGESHELRPNYKPAHISEELAALGYYARSMKPPKGWLSERKCFYIFFP